MIKAIIYDMGDIFYDSSKWRKWLYNYLKSNNISNKSYSEIFEIWEHQYLIKSYIDKK